MAKKTKHLDSDNSLKVSEYTPQTGLGKMLEETVINPLEEQFLGYILDLVNPVEKKGK